MRFGRSCWPAAPKRDCAARWRLWKRKPESSPLSFSSRSGKEDNDGHEHDAVKIDVLTLFPAMFAGPLDESIIKRAREAGLLDLKIHQLRDYTHDKHKTVDDRPFGGGPGMLLKPEPIFEAVEAIARDATRVILLSPSGRPFSQAIARELAACDDLLIVTGHYEGFDERIRE